MPDTSEQVSTEVADSDRGNMVRHTYGYSGGHVNPDGSFVHSGLKTSEGYSYTALDGTSYSRGWLYHGDNSPPEMIGHSVMGPVIDRTQTRTASVVNHANRVYSHRRTDFPITGDTTERPYPGLELWSSPARVRQGIQSGEAVEQGTTTVGDIEAIALAITVPGASNLHRTMYVDARTHQPLRTVTLADGNPLPFVADWLPATPDNVAKANDHTIPDGYAEVEDAGQSWPI